MKNSLLRKVKQNKAFTLMEMMITVSILVALLAITVVGIVDWSKKIKMTELDNYAKSVYLEAQNQISAMEAEGSLPRLYFNFADEEDGIYYKEYGNRKLTETPADYDLALYGDFYKGIYYFTSEDSVTTMFVPAISTSDEYGNYLIEVNPQTGDVYGVFYWEDSNEYLESSIDVNPDEETEIETEMDAELEVDGETKTEEQLYAEAIYTKIKNMEVKGEGNNRSLESRTEFQIGYYGGIAGNTLSTSEYKLDQDVKIVNGEELYLELSYNLDDTLMNPENTANDKFNIEVTIKGETSKAEWVQKHVLEYGTNYYEDMVNDRLITFVLLDGMRDGESFAEITNGKSYIPNENPDEEPLQVNLIPGENLEISVKTIYQYNGVIVKEQSSVYRTNSLFHDVTDRYVENGAEHTIERTIGVSSMRHLRNLGENYYAGDIVTTVNGESIDSYVIVQKNDIDFDKGSYVFGVDDFGKTVYTGGSASPILHLEPIENESIFWNDKETRVDGNDFAIRNLIVKDEDANAMGVGLFGKAKNTHFINVKLEDYTLSAESDSKYVGALVGYAVGGKIEKSGVYLATSYRDENDIKHYYSQLKVGNKTVMLNRYNEMTITGGDEVGGLAGRIEGTYVEDSYSAVQVIGNNTVGGLIGYGQGVISEGFDLNNLSAQDVIDGIVSIKNSYASGDVYGGNRVGGFVGEMQDLAVENAYASGDVYADDLMAGFVANAVHSFSKDCYAYGEVLSTDKDSQFDPDEVTVGGFFAAGPDSYCDVRVNGYLSQVGYNAADTGFTDGQNGLKKEYNELTSLVTDSSAANSHPYDENLLFKAFPFKRVTEHHYGDWPIQYYINTSLVYYEKYADGSYGFYSVTKLTDVTDANADSNKYVWVLDSLSDYKECKEDGYALLSMFRLVTVDYKVYQYTTENDWKVAKSADGTETIEGTLEADSSYAAGDNSNRMVRLMNTTALEFKAYEQVEKPYSANYDGKEPQSAFKTSGMYLYQLPYELQNTYRYNVDNFYDVIVFDKGYAEGNTVAESGGLEPTPVISNEVYYYCPHFSRLAINPGLGESESTDPAQFVELEQPETVAIRTARQLNNLGRVPFYWNNRGLLDKSLPYNIIRFEQEVDINFGTYARWTDDEGRALAPSYCGRTYNLLAFDTEYENQPIGQIAQMSTGYGAFQNDYDGNYHKIIDYCVKSSNQYVGLFGEIFKEGGATREQISNVVMVVSDANKVNQGNYLTASEENQNNAGLIISNYQEKSNATGNKRQRAGVGALVGSDYTLGVTDGEAEIFTIYNCASAGYKVQYHVEPKKGADYQQPLGVAVGGLIGYSRGNVAQSSAVNDVKLVARESVTGNNASFMLGGFTGSAFFGTTLNCYAGGSIDVDDNSANGTRYYINRLRIGGFCPGWMYAPGVENEKNKEDVRFQNIYSYTEVKDRVWNVRESSSNSKVFNHLIPTVSRMRVTYSDDSWHTESKSGATAVRVPGFSYYLDSKITAEMLSKNSSDALSYYKNGSNKPKTCDAASYIQLSRLDWVNQNYSVWQDVHFETSEGYQTLQKAVDGYPFPAFVTNAAGEYVHYGDYPQVPETTLPTGTIFKDGSFKLDGSYKDSLLTSTSDIDGDYDWYSFKDESGKTVYYTDFDFTLNHNGDYSHSLEVKCVFDGLEARVLLWHEDAYLTFNSNGTCGYTTNGGYVSMPVGIKPDVKYRLYIKGLNVDEDINNQSVTWELVEIP